MNPLEQLVMEVGRAMLAEEEARAVSREASSMPKGCKVGSPAYQEWRAAYLKADRAVGEAARAVQVAMTGFRAAALMLARQERNP